MKLLLGDCLDKLKELDDNSIDSIVTDPPYGLSFMGKDWDKVKATQETKSQVVKGLGAGMKMTTLADNIEFEKWVTEWSMECMRVLKPGGYMLAFGGSRMYHRLASGVENAGFEIRDQMMWIYGSGFPKSLNIGKGIDKKGGENISWFIDYVLGIMEERGISMQDMTKLMPSKTGKTTGWWYNKAKYKTQGLTLEQFNLIKNALNLPFDDLEETEREVLGKQKTNLTVMQNIGGDYTPGKVEVTKGNSEWEGWGTALKPAHEPIVMARKPLSEKTIVDNVLEWGTCGINIDDSRIEGQWIGSTRTTSPDTKQVYGDYGKEITEIKEQGRFPANIIFDEEAGKILDEQSGHLKSGFMKAGTTRKMSEGDVNTYGHYDSDTTYNDTYGDSGGASRFFYCPKTSKRDRNEGLDDFEEKSRSNANKMMGKSGNFKTGSGNDRTTEFKNNHPTVKPTDLMIYLIRMVTPKGGTTLDPFMGSGSTGKAAVRGGFDFVGVEREEEYMKIAKARIQYEQDNPYNEETNTRVHINKNSNKFW